jgi:hypothetical protein
MRVSGKFVRGGKRVTIQIMEDGSSEETVEDADSDSSSGYSYIKSTQEGGGSSVHIQIDGDLSALVREVLPISKLLPPALLAFLCHPLVLCASCCWCCNHRGRGHTEYRPPSRQEKIQ